jgi:hypothetical protein
MMITDPWVQGLLSPPKWMVYAVMALFVVFVCALSKAIINRRQAAMAPARSPIVDGAA